MDILSLALSKKFTKNTADEFGAVKGAPCTVGETSIDENGNTVVKLVWTNSAGKQQTTKVTIQKGKDGKDGEDGVSIKEAVIRDEHLILILTDDTEIDAGEIGSSAELAEDLTATVAIGTVTAGKKYTKGTPLEKIIRDILIKEEAPVVALNLNPTKTLYDVVSETLTTIVLSAVVTKKTYAPTKITFYVDDVIVNEKAISDGGTFSYTHTFSPATKVNHTFKAVVTDGKFSGNATKTIKFVAKSYYGILSDDIGTPTEAQIKGLTNSVLKDTNGLTYSGITTSFGKVCYAYPKEFGALTSIKDTVNNYSYTDSFSKTTVTVDGIDYYVYIQTDPSAADNVKLVFA